MAGVDEKEVKERMKKVHWVPLESNPEMLTNFAHQVGLPADWEFTDVYGVDEGLLLTTGSWKHLPVKALCGCRSFTAFVISQVLCR